MVTDDIDKMFKRLFGGIIFFLGHDCLGLAGT